ncbi:DsbA family protein [Kitasatospora sp. NPDC059811]|uniref:DsbA family protein n=1 Tax=Streptomycetaceae TaxID=2062 RepID=UPI0007AEF4FA|nr:thioredoxin domain-containing protein [Streptomyces sp. MJM8645]
MTFWDDEDAPNPTDDSPAPSDRRQSVRTGSAHRTRKRVLLAVTVAAVVVGGGFLFRSGFGPDHAEPPSGSSGDSIPVGYQQAPATLVVYEDYDCAACRKFAERFDPTLRQLVAENRLVIQYHPVTTDGRKTSAQAANAAACAQDAGKFAAFREVLVAAGKQDPDAKQGLRSLADRVSELRSAAFDRCVDDGTHAGWVSRESGTFAKQFHTDAPVAVLNGDRIEIDGDGAATKLWKTVEDLALKDPGFHPPVSTPSHPPASTGPAATASGSAHAAPSASASASPSRARTAEASGRTAAASDARESSHDSDD